MGNLLVKYGILVFVIIVSISSCEKESRGREALRGYVYYANTTIPVSGAFLTIDGISAITDNDGKYAIINIVGGEQILSVTKQGYDNFTVSLQITPGLNRYNVEMISNENTHDLKGTVTSINLLDKSGPLAYCNVVVLNPDGSESNLKTITNESGDYQISRVPIGNRTIRFVEDDHEITDSNILMDKSVCKLDIDIQFIYIGRHLAGGVIGYVLQPNDHGYIEGQLNGLIAAPTDVGIAEWGCTDDSIGGTSIDFSTGAENTAAIIAGCSISGIAARLCDELELNGYNDWFLPSAEELKALHNNRKLIGGFNEGGTYVSSSEYEINTVIGISPWRLNYTGNAYYTIYPKDFRFHVRAVRIF